MWAQTGDALAFLQPESSGSNCQVSRATLGVSPTATVIVTGVACNAKIYELTSENAILIAVADSTAHFLNVYRAPTNSSGPVGLSSLSTILNLRGSAHQWTQTSDGALMALLTWDSLYHVGAFPSTLNSSGALNTIYSTGATVSGISFRQ